MFANSSALLLTYLKNESSKLYWQAVTQTVYAE